MRGRLNMCDMSKYAEEIGRFYDESEVAAAL